MRHIAGGIVGAIIIIRLIDSASDLIADFFEWVSNMFGRLPDKLQTFIRLMLIGLVLSPFTPRKDKEPEPPVNNPFLQEVEPKKEEPEVKTGLNKYTLYRLRCAEIAAIREEAMKLPNNDKFLKCDKELMDEHHKNEEYYKSRGLSYFEKPYPELYETLMEECMGYDVFEDCEHCQMYHDAEVPQK